MIHLTENGHLKIVAWVELDVSTETKLQRSKVNLFTKSKQLKKRLIWLTSDVRVLNTRNYHNEIPGMSIQLAGDNA